MAEQSSLRCKQCGEYTLDPNRAVGGVVKCNICGFCFTLPRKEISPAALSFLRQGEHDLDACDFEKAYTAYQKAAELDKNEPEAYFGMALAKFKVQYLKDEVNNHLQPICHEISEKVFTEDKDYKKALELATLDQKKVYRAKGGEIDDIRDEFFALKKSGLDYDCFLCVKVTAEDGSRTEDYDRANDLYYNLKDKGYSPFFSERELKGKTGSDYEAHILYALYTSECMLVVCSDEEYLHTKWVKNEYTRFLSMIANEEKERDSVAFVFHGKPIEKLPGRSGKLQGIDLSKPDAYSRIIDYVEKHTPAARARREEEAREKQEAEAARDRELKELREKLAQMQAEQSNNASISEANILELIRRAQEEARKQEETQKEEETRKREEEGQYVCGYCGSLNLGRTHNCKYCGGSAADFIPLAQYQLQQEERRKQEEARKAAEEEARRQEEARKAAEEARRQEEARKTEAERLNAAAQRAEEIWLAQEAQKRAEDAKRQKEVEQKPWLASDYPTLQDYNKNEFDILGTVLEEYKIKNVSGEVKVPLKITKIGFSAFSNLTGLTAVTIPNGVKSIAANAFRNCKNLRKVVFGRDVTEVGAGAFEGCSSLTEISIPFGVTRITEELFRNCEALRHINFPEGVSRIDARAFENCSRITQINLPSSVTMISGDAFQGCPVETIQMPENSVYRAEGNCLIRKENNSVVLGCKNSVIPDGVTSIGARAFYGCKELTNIVLPDGIKGIGSSAFEKCERLVNIAIPSSVTAIGMSAFAGCISLMRFKIPDRVTVIETELFCGCRSLVDLTISPNVTKIERRAFSGCSSLAVLAIPVGVELIAASAFENCISLKYVTISKEYKNFSNSQLKGLFGKQYNKIQFTFWK